MQGTTQLHLTLTHHWYDEIAAGRKFIEYRKVTPFWTKRLSERTYDQIVFHRGYTSTTITAWWMGMTVGDCPIDGWTGEYYRLLFSPIGVLTD